MLIATTTALSGVTGALATDNPNCPTAPGDDDNEDGSGSDTTGGDSSEESSELTVESFPLQEGTEYETEGYVIDAPESGPTAVVIGGMHGDEVAGYRAAETVTDLEPNQGTLVVVPEANAVAVQRGTRSSDSGNLNRHFPSGQDPTSPLASDIWETITEFDADLVIDLHTSRGVWDPNADSSGYGQAIFPTSEGRDLATEMINYANDTLLDADDSDRFQFQIGNTLTGTRPLLVHKVGSDLDQPGYILEATRQGTTVDTQTEWLADLTAEILSRSGIEV